MCVNCGTCSLASLALGRRERTPYLGIQFLGLGGEFRRDERQPLRALIDRGVNLHDIVGSLGVDLNAVLGEQLCMQSVGARIATRLSTTYP